MAGSVEIQCHANSRQRKVSVSARKFLEGPAGVWRRRGEADLGENLAFFKGRGEVGNEEVGTGNRTLTVGPVGFNLCVEEHRDGGVFGRRVRVGDRAADRASSTNLRVRDHERRGMNQRLGTRTTGRIVHAALRRHRTDAEAAVVFPDEVERVQFAEVNEELWASHPHVHRGDETLSPCENVGFDVFVCEVAHGFV